MASMLTGEKRIHPRTERKLRDRDQKYNLFFSQYDGKDLRPLDPNNIDPRIDQELCEIVRGLNGQIPNKDFVKYIEAFGANPLFVIPILRILNSLPQHDRITLEKINYFLQKYADIDSETPKTEFELAVDFLIAHKLAIYFFEFGYTKLAKGFAPQDSLWQSEI